MLELWGVVLSTFSRGWLRDDLNISNTWGSKRREELEHSRWVYNGLLRSLFHLLSSLWTPESVSCLIYFTPISLGIEAA